MQLSLIAAMTRNKIIGSENTMPWHLPADLAHFRALTLGKTIIMGHLTFLSIGKPLPQRRNILLSTDSQLSIPGCEIYSSLTAALAACSDKEELMVIGGAKVFQQTLPLATKMYLTMIDCEKTGDRYFPSWHPDEWHITKSAPYPADQANPYDMLMLEYTRIANIIPL